VITPDEILTSATRSRATDQRPAGYYFDKRRGECVQAIENLLAVAERRLEVFDTDGARHALLQVEAFSHERDVINEMHKQ
jgi:hypothetical protein